MLPKLPAYNTDSNDKLKLIVYCACCGCQINTSRRTHCTRNIKSFACLDGAFDQRVLAVIEEQTGLPVTSVTLHNICAKKLQVQLSELQHAKENARTRTQAAALAAVPDPQERALPGAAEKAARLAVEAGASGAVR